MRADEMLGLEEIVKIWRKVTSQAVSLLRSEGPKRKQEKEMKNERRKSMMTSEAARASLAVCWEVCDRSTMIPSLFISWTTVCKRQASWKPYTASQPFGLNPKCVQISGSLIFSVDCCNRVIVGSKSTMALELNFSGTTVSHIDQLMVWIHLPRTFIEIIFYKSSSRSSSSPLSVAMSSWSWSSSIPCQRLWVHCVAGWPQVGQHCCNPPCETNPHYYLIWTSPAWQFG